MLFFMKISFDFQFVTKKLFSAKVWNPKTISNLMNSGNRNGEIRKIKL